MTFAGSMSYEERQALMRNVLSQYSAEGYAVIYQGITRYHEQQAPVPALLSVICTREGYFSWRSLPFTLHNDGSVKFASSWVDHPHDTMAQKSFTSFFYDPRLN